MIINVWIEDNITGERLEVFGEVMCDSESRAIQMYEGECEKWADKGYEPILVYENMSEIPIRKVIEWEED